MRENNLLCGQILRKDFLEGTTINFADNTEMARIVPDGALLLTTPNRLTSFSENPYHVREYAPDELYALVAPLFASVTLLGVHGNAKVQAFDGARRRAVERILRFDPLGFRRLLPRWLVTHAFARLAVLVRRQVRESTAAPRITPEDFAVRADAIENALDLVALCHGPTA